MGQKKNLKKKIELNQIKNFISSPLSVSSDISYTQSDVSSVNNTPSSSSDYSYYSISLSSSLSTPFISSSAFVPSPTIPSPLNNKDDNNRLMCYHPCCSPYSSVTHLTSSLSVSSIDFDNDDDNNGDIKGNVYVRKKRKKLKKKKKINKKK
jgi:hypothetical protein